MITATADTYPDLPIGPSLERNRKVLEIYNDTFDLVRRHRNMLARPFVSTVLLPITVGQVLVNLFFEQVTSNISGRGAYYARYFTSGSDSADLFFCVAGIFMTFLGTVWGIALFNSVVLWELESDGIESGEKVGRDVEMFKDRYRELRSTALAAGFGLILAVIVVAVPLILIGQIPLLSALLVLAALILVPLYVVRLALFFPARLIEDHPVRSSL
jgi:hypothetical protein